MKARKFNIFAGLVLFALGVTSCATANVDANPHLANKPQKASGSAELVFNSLRGTVDIDSRYGNIGDTKTFTVTPNETYYVYKVEFNGKEVKPSEKDGSYSVTLEKNNYVRILYDANVDDQFTYRRSDSRTYYEIVSYQGNKAIKDLILPRKHRGYPVREVRMSALYGLDLDSVYVPETYRSFEYVNNKERRLESVYFYKESTDHGYFSRNEINAETLLFEDEQKVGEDHHGHEMVSNDISHCISYVEKANDFTYVVNYDGQQSYVTLLRYSGSDNKLVMPETIEYQGSDYIVRDISIEDLRESEVVIFAKTNVNITIESFGINKYIYVPISVKTFNTMDKLELIYYEGSDTSLFDVEPGHVVTNCNKDLINVDGIYYRIENDEAKLFYYGLSEEVITLKDEITVNGKQYKVTEILPFAFIDSKVKCVTANESLVRIGRFAFEHGLHYFIANDNLKYIEEKAFNGSCISPMKGIVEIGEENYITGDFYLSPSLKVMKGYIFSKFIYTNILEIAAPSYWDLDTWFEHEVIHFGFVSHEGFDKEIYRYDLYKDEQNQPYAALTKINVDALENIYGYVNIPSHVEDNIPVKVIEENACFNSGGYTETVFIPKTIEKIHPLSLYASAFYVEQSEEEFKAHISSDFMERHSDDIFICHEDIHYFKDNVADKAYMVYTNETTGAEEAILLIGYSRDGDIPDTTSSGIKITGLDLSFTDDLDYLILSDNIETIIDVRYKLKIRDAFYTGKNLKNVYGNTMFIAEYVAYGNDIQFKNVEAVRSDRNCSKIGNYIIKDNGDQTCNVIHNHLDENGQIYLPLNIDGKKVVYYRHVLPWSIYCQGTLEEMQGVTIEKESSTKVYYYSATKPDPDSNEYFWHFTSNGKRVTY